MTTPEERTRAIITSHTETMAALRYASREDVRLEGTKAMLTLEGSITQAIRQAENDKLEEAARWLEEMPPSNEVEDFGTAAILIRELKSKG